MKMKNSAEISSDGLYRYSLTRQWDWDSPYEFVWIMLNPSTADAMQDDPTIRRCINFTKREGYGGLTIFNLFAYRATNPKLLLETDDPVGPHNIGTMMQLFVTIPHVRVICAWGTKGTINDQNVQVLEMLRDWNIKPECLGKTKDGHPKHPLYVAANTPFEPLEI